MLQAERSPVRVLDEVDIFILPNYSSRFMALSSTRPPTEMRTRNLSRGKKRPARRADNLAAVSRMSENMGEPQPLATLRASTVCTRITLPYLTLMSQPFSTVNSAPYSENF
jgi:hypothetical protein